MHTGFEFSFPESQQDHFTVSLDKALALVKLDRAESQIVETDREMTASRWR